MDSCLYLVTAFLKRLQKNEIENVGDNELKHVIKDVILGRYRDY